MSAGSQNVPDFNAWITSEWGYPYFEGCLGSFAGASNVIVGTNPPYSITDFFAFFPKYGGKNLPLSGIFTAGLTLVTGVDTTSLAVGQYVGSAGNLAFPSGTIIVQINVSNQAGQLTLSQPAMLTGVAACTAYVGSPLVPVAVINAYIALASASLVYNRWLDTWMLAIALFTAHFVDLYLRSQGNCSSTCAQAATAGLKSGITIGVSAGGVSQTLKPVPGIDEWGQWAQTAAGVQLVQFARAMGAGSLWLY